MPAIQPRREFLTQALKIGATVALAGGALPCCLLRALAADAPPSAPDGTRQRPLEEFGYCGSECEECSVYQATRRNDLAEKQRIADGWNQAYGVSIQPADVACDGCRTQTGRLGYHCEYVCDVRKCGRARAIASCAVCADFPTCDRQLWKHWPAMRRRTAERRREMRQDG